MSILLLHFSPLPSTSCPPPLLLPPSFLLLLLSFSLPPSSFSSSPSPSLLPPSPPLLLPPSPPSPPSLPPSSFPLSLSPSLPPSLPPLSQEQFVVCCSAGAIHSLNRPVSSTTLHRALQYVCSYIFHWSPVRARRLVSSLLLWWLIRG